MIIAGITVIMIFIAHPNKRLFLMWGGILAVLVVLARIMLQITLGEMTLDMDNVENFRLARVLVWLNPEKYSSEGGYQIMQAMLSEAAAFSERDWETVCRSLALCRKPKMI